MENKSKLGPSGEEKKGKSKCPICKKQATLLCTGCQSVSYCCVDHQKKHWKLHQPSCVFFHIKDDPSEFTGAGKYCVASRDLKAGAQILEELPVLHMPSPSQRIHDCCITCAVVMPSKSERNASNSCPKCNWPVCGTACAEFPLHAANECQVFVANKIPYPQIIPGSQLPLSELIVYPLLMRVYAVMIQNPSRWKELLEMLKRNDIGSRRLDVTICDMMYPVTLEKIASASSHFPRITKEDESLLSGLLPKVRLLTLTQGYSITIREDSTVPGCSLIKFRPRIADYVYKTARHFVHSCSPNCFWTVGTFPDFKMQIWTSVAVKKGEKLTVSRFICETEFGHGTRNRQKHFQDIFELPCRCNLCLDPIEFGTFQSAVVCALCKTGSDANSEPGYLLPVDPLNVTDDAPWKCSKCKKITIASKFCDKLQEIAHDLDKKVSESLTGDKICEAFIEMYRDKLVHSNHWLIQLAGILIRECQIPRIGSMSIEELSGFETLMHFLLDVKNKIFSGIFHERSEIIDSLGDAMYNRLINPFAQKEYSKEFFRKPREDLLGFLAEAEKGQQYHKEALLYYKHIPNIGRGETVDLRLSRLQKNIQNMERFKSDIIGRLAEIEIQRLNLGIN